MRSFQEDLDRAVAYHGHLCSGQITGVRMARYALRTLGIEDPDTYRDLIVYLECDRCLADAVGTVTHCTIGKRRLKWFDYGKSAATFLDLKTGRAIRLYRKLRVFPPEGADLVEFFNGYADEELFSLTEVEVDYKPTDLPGKPLDAQVCAFCGEEILDGRQVMKDGKICCRACSGGTYYKVREALK